MLKAATLQKTSIIVTFFSKFIDDVVIEVLPDF